MSTSHESRSQSPTEDRGEKNAPVWSRRYWTGSANLEIAVFEKTVGGQRGEFRTFNVSIKRTYKDGDEYKEAKGFRAEDVPVLASALLQAHAFIAEEMNS